MNFEESNKFVEKMEENTKRKKVVIYIIGFCFILLILLFISIFLLKAKDANVQKMYVNDKQVSISTGLMKEGDDCTYYNIKKMCQLLNYSYQQGEYAKYNENIDSCYFSNKYCITTINQNSNKLIKYLINEEKEEIEEEKEVDDENIVEEDPIIVESNDKTKEIVFLSDEIKLIDDNLYVSENDIEKMFNVKIDSENENRIKFYTVDVLGQYYATKINKSNYEGISNCYENLTAILDDMLVVKNGNKYGVLSLETGNEIVSLKYDKIVYMQGSKEFIVTVEDSMGVVSNIGETIINPTEYDHIENLGILFDESDVNKLYLVKKNDKYGVVNKNNEIIVFVEYDSIGLENPEDFPNEKIDNYNLIFDKFIPVYSDDKVGLFNIEGDAVLKCNYDGLGCIVGKKSNDTSNTVNSVGSTKSTVSETNSITNQVSNSNVTDLPSGATSVLTIPESAGLEGIVVKFGDLYGIFGSKEQSLVVPCNFSNIYSITKSNVTHYYLVYNGNTMELTDFLTENEI